MTDGNLPPLDEIGPWSEIKLEIVRKYADAAARIVKRRFHYAYVDGFAGAGIHISKETGDQVPGSPLNALAVQPPFDEYHFVERDPEKVAWLHSRIGDHPNVHIREGDCNEILPRDVFPQIRYRDFRRALCLLDPYGLHVQWEVILAAGRLKTVDLLLNFPLMDMNRNVLWTQPDRVDIKDRTRMTAFWGDESWRQVTYGKDKDLFGTFEKKLPNEAVAEAFRTRLREVAGFARVPPPLAMKNSRGAVVYYLFFGSQQKVAEKIAADIFEKYRTSGGA